MDVLRRILGDIEETHMKDDQVTTEASNGVTLSTVILYLVLMCFSYSTYQMGRIATTLDYCEVEMIYYMKMLATMPDVL